MEYENEIDELLDRAAKRQEALKMPKPKEHWKQRRKRLLERSRKQEARPEVIAYRQAYVTSLRGRWIKLRRLARQRGWEWDLSFEDWCWMWTMAEPAKRQGLEVPAHLAKGRGKDQVRVKRIDPKKPFTFNNLQILQGHRVLWRDG